jgi:hypothetical protein
MSQGERFWSSNASLRRHGYQPSLSVSGEGQASQDVLAGKVGKISQDLILRHAGSEVLQYVVDSDAQPADTRLATTLVRLDGDSVLIPHGEKPTLGTLRRSNWASGRQIGRGHGSAD